MLHLTKSIDHSAPRRPTTLSAVDGEYSPIPQMPESTVSQQFITHTIDAYFVNYHTSYPFLHEATFRAQYAELVPRPDDRTWNLVLYTVLALGAWTIGDEHDHGEFNEMFYRKASSFWQDQSIFESANLATVQALVLLSNYAQKRNKPNTGWNYLGLAVRMAVSLGLHRELPEWNITLLQREMRRRVWWGLFIFDSGASVTFGRAILLPERDMIDVKHVLNISDGALTPMTTHSPSESGEPTIYSSLKVQSELHLAANPVSNRLLCAPNITPEEALSLHKPLLSWAAAVPSYFQLDRPASHTYDWYLFARSKLWWRYWNLEIILFRPFVLRAAIQKMHGRQLDLSSNHDDSKRLCLEAAHRTIFTVDEYIHHNALTRLQLWYSL
jgi:transcriptional regulatory protein GAL4